MAFPPLLPIPPYDRGLPYRPGAANHDATDPPVAAVRPDASVPAPHAFDTALWERLQAMRFNSAEGSGTFMGRLARENGWQPQHTCEVIEEYRRFLYLAARAGHPVSPPEAVDKAWHLHLLYTRHYWGVLCRQVLGFELHHDPVLGTSGETEKFAGWYRRTLQSYRAAFGEAPPPRIWPAADADAYTSRRASSWLRRYGKLAVAAVLLPLAAGLWSLGAGGPVAAVALGGIALLFVWNTARAAGGCSRSGGGGCGGGGPSGSCGGGGSGCGGGCGGSG